MGTFEANLATFLQWLLKATLQGSLLVCLILLIKVVLREKLPARWHYCLWLVLLIRLALPWAPPSRISIYGLIPGSFSSHDAASGFAVPPPNEARARPDAIVRGDSVARTSAADQTGTSQPGQGGTAAKPSAMQPPLETPASSNEPSSQASGQDHQLAAFVIRILAWVWLTGGAILAGYILIRAFGLWRAVTSERPVTDQQVLDLLEDCKMQMRVRTLVGVVVTDKVQTPALFGVIRPRILLPQGLIGTFGLDELHCIFLHELAHLRRRDICLAWLVCLLQVLHWFNPLIWFALRRMRADQEMAADALALSAAGTDESRLYGQTIVNLLERFSRPQYLPSLAGILENPSHIERRIQMIAKFNRTSPRPLLATALLAVLGLMTLTDAQTGSGTSSQPSARTDGSDLIIRRVWTGPKVDQSGRISRDGRLLSYADWETGDLAIHDLVTGTDRRLTNKGSWEESSAFAESSVISPDGKQVAYAWFDGQGSYQVRLMPTAGEEPRILYRDTSIAWIGLGGWSPDSQYVLASISSKPSGYQIGLISVVDGSLRVLKNSQARTLYFSPDGRFVAYDTLPPGVINRTDVWLLKIDGASQIPLVQHPADDVLLGWSPDGQWILFASDRGGTMDAWKIRVEEGQPQGEPVLVKSHLGQDRSLGITQDGSLFYSMKEQSTDVFTVTLDAAAGKIMGQPKRVADRYLGHNYVPAWSPDGKVLAYRSKRGNSWFLCLRSMDTGDQRDLPLQLQFFGFPVWSTDGKQLRVYGRSDSEHPSDTFEVNLQTGALKAMNSDGFQLLQARSQTTAFRWNKEGKQVLAKDVQTGQVKVLYKFPEGETLGGQRGVISPEADQLALLCRSETSGDARNSLRVVSVADGMARDVLATTKKIGAFAWMPDGRSLVCSVSNELCLLDLAGGPPRKLGLVLAIRELSVHPDGQRIAFESGGQKSEVWVMENLFPKSVKEKDAIAETSR